MHDESRRDLRGGSATTGYWHWYGCTDVYRNDQRPISDRIIAMENRIG